jgi:septal ring factor EnvC (AmiA/AmiB activator)
MSYRKLLAFLLFVGISGQFARGDELKQIKAKIEVEDAKLTQIRKDRTAISNDLQKVKLELQKLDKTKSEQNQILSKTEKELRVVELSQSENDRQLVEETFQLETSLIELYKVQKRRKGLELLLNANSSMGLLKRGHQLGKMADYGDEVMKRLAELKQQLTGEKLKFEELLMKRRQDLEVLQKTLDAVALKKKENQTLLNESQKKEKEQKAILAGLAEQARQIEKAIASVTGEEKEGVTPPDSYDGGGLEAFKGKLELPVRGKLIQSFGKSQSQEFSDLVVVKGLEIAASTGAKVFPVATGKVVLADVVPGFGNVVIVDHGSRFYSLYGRLSTTIAQVGTVVSTSDPVGVTGELDFKGRNFYFEIRVKGKAVDPKSYFSSHSLSEIGA